MLLLKSLLSISLLALNNAGIYNKTKKSAIIRHSINAIHVVGIVVLLKGLICYIRPTNDTPEDDASGSVAVEQKDLIKREEIIQSELIQPTASHIHIEQQSMTRIRQTPEMAKH